MKKLLIITAVLFLIGLIFGMGSSRIWHDENIKETFSDPGSDRG